MEDTHVCNRELGTVQAAVDTITRWHRLPLPTTLPSFLSLSVHFISSPLCSFPRQIHRFLSNLSPVHLMLARTIIQFALLIVPLFTSSRQQSSLQIPLGPNLQHVCYLVIGVAMFSPNMRPWVIRLYSHLLMIYGAISNLKNPQKKCAVHANAVWIILQWFTNKEDIVGCSTKHSPTWYVFRQHWLACLDFPPRLHKPGETELFHKGAVAVSVFTTGMICGGEKKTNVSIRQCNTHACGIVPSKKKTCRLCEF